MTDLTTAQRLAAYRDELATAGFDGDLVRHIVGQAAPRLIEDIEIQADLDNVTPAIGAVTVKLTPSIADEDVARVVGQITRRAQLEQERRAVKG